MLFLWVWALLFMVGGTVSTYAFIRPTVQTLNARNWTRVPCVIDDSRVIRRSSSAESPSPYDVELSFHFDFQGRRYASDRYWFHGPIGNRQAAQAVADQYPRGREVECYVDSETPRRAVLNRRHQPRELLAFTLPLFFLAGGTGGIYLLLMHGIKRWEGVAYVPLRKVATELGLCLLGVVIVLFSIAWRDATHSTPDGRDLGPVSDARTEAAEVRASSLGIPLASMSNRSWGDHPTWRYAQCESHAQ